MCFRCAICLKVLSRSGMREGGLCFKLWFEVTSVNEVTSWWPPFVFLTRKDGFNYSTVMPISFDRLKTPRFSSSNLYWSSISLSLPYIGRRLFLCSGSIGTILTRAWKGATAPLYPIILRSNTLSYSARKVRNCSWICGCNRLSGSNLTLRECFELRSWWEG